VYRFVIPLQFTIGLLVLAGTIGAMEIGESNPVVLILQGAVGLLLMAGIVIY
jgi:hypothetical protein